MNSKHEPNCKFCNIEQEIQLEKGWYVSLLIGEEKSGKLYFRASGEDYTDKYYPKYCPECGKLLLPNS